MATPDLITPFRVAINGMVHTFRTQRHMRIHLYVTLVTLLVAVVLPLRVRDVLVLFFMIGSVLVAEMFNSAIEAVVDLASPHYHPMAKFAKDIAAGAVLIATIMAITAGALIAIGDDAWERIKLGLTSEGFALPFAARFVGGSLILFTIVVIGKGLGKRGNVLQGGLVSGHAAFGFFFASSIPFITDNALASVIAIMLALVIAQSRYEAKFHSIFELTLGATVGSILGITVFGVLPR
ncbi:MAG: diacylglycerol kinase [Armatimonadetes bacterium]|nr:diacylglycerol kinase [Armatimonadota bacterium]